MRLQTKQLTIFEHQTIQINETGAPSFSPNELRLLEQLNKKHNNTILEPKHHNGEVARLTASQFIGVLIVGNKQIQILPKIAQPELPTEDYKNQIINNLLYMLTKTKHLTIRETDTSSLQKKTGSFIEILIYLFTQNLSKLIQNSLDKNYHHHEENLPFLKGKLLFTQNIKINSTQKTRFFVHFDEFSENTLINKTIKYTLTILQRLSHDQRNLKLLEELLFIFADIPFETITPTHLEYLTFNRLNQRFEPIINLCKILISNSTIELSHHSLITFSFIFDMNKLFEEFIAESLKEAYPEAKIKCQVKGTYLVQKEATSLKTTYNQFQLRPDLVIYSQNNQVKSIIDTKYKQLNSSLPHNGISQQDLYQMFTYAKKFKTNNTLLLYPQTAYSPSNISLTMDESTSTAIRTINLNRNLKKQKKEFLQELRLLIT